jgi:hypothetical protein
VAIPQPSLTGMSTQKHRKSEDLNKFPVHNIIHKVSTFKLKISCDTKTQEDPKLNKKRQ